MDIRLRQAVQADRSTLYTWRNDPWIIQHGARQTAVTWDEHTRWFEKVLTEPGHLLFLIETMAGEGIGCVRFERHGQARAEIHIYLLQAYIGKGLGPLAIARACAAAFEHWPTVEAIGAQVRGGNRRSCLRVRASRLCDGGRRHR